MPWRLAGLWRHSDFNKLWAGQTVSAFGSIIGNTALLFTAVLVLDATPSQMALVTAAGLAPGVVAGLVAGVWVDRLPRRPVLIGADLGRMVFLSTIPLAALLGFLRMEHLYIVAFLTGILTVFFEVAYQSYLPSLVRREDLIEGNSKLSASSSIAEVGGFGLAGWLVQLLTAPIAILVDAISFLFSAAFVGLIRAPEPPSLPVAKRRGLLREMSEGLRAVLRDPLLRALAGCTLTVNLSFRIFGTVFLLYVTRDLGFEPGILGMIFAVGGISSFLGTVATGRVTRRLGIGRAMVAGLVLMGLSQVFIPLAQGATVIAVLLLVAQQLMGDGAFIVYDISQVSLRQALAPERLLGRVNAGVQFIELGAMLLGLLIGGLLGETLGLRATLVVGACGTALAALWLVLSPVWALKAIPASAAETPAAFTSAQGTLEE